VGQGFLGGKRELLVTSHPWILFVALEQRKNFYPNATTTVYDAWFLVGRFLGWLAAKFGN